MRPCDYSHGRKYYITTVFRKVVAMNPSEIALSALGDEETEVLEVTDTDLDLRAKVILFNDEEHTFDEVVSQIQLATGCSAVRAELLTWEVHTKGKAVVYEGKFENALRVSSILEEIALRTQLEC